MGISPARPLRPTTSSAAGMSVVIVQPPGVVISELLWRRSRSYRPSSAAVTWRSSRCCATGRSCSISITPSSKSRRRDTPEIRVEIKRADRAEIRRQDALTNRGPSQAEGLCLADEVIGNDEIAEIIAKFTAKSIRLFLWIDGVFAAPCISSPPPNFAALTGGLQVHAHLPNLATAAQRGLTIAPTRTHAHLPNLATAGRRGARRGREPLVHVLRAQHDLVALPGEMHARSP